MMRASGVPLVGVAPDVVVAVGPVGVLARRLEPRVLVGAVVHDEVGDDPHAALVRRVDELDEVADVPNSGSTAREVADVVAAVAQRRLVERQQPQAVDAEPLQVVELVGEAPQVAGAVAVGVGEAADQHLVEHRALEPVGSRDLSAAEVVGLWLNSCRPRHGLAGVRVSRAHRPTSARCRGLCVAPVRPGRVVSSTYVRRSSHECAQARTGPAVRSWTGPTRSSPVSSSCTGERSCQLEPQRGQVERRRSLAGVVRVER